MQRRGEENNRCRLGCPRSTLGAEDSAEHYFRCQIGREVGEQTLNLRGSDASRDQCFLQTQKIANKEEGILWSLLAYGLYQAQCTARAEGRWLNHREGIQAVKQGIRKGATGNIYCSKLVDGRFIV